jgi:hypothetical protein
MIKIVITMWCAVVRGWPSMVRAQCILKLVYPVDIHHIAPDIVDVVLKRSRIRFQVRQLSCERSLKMADEIEEIK